MNKIADQNQVLRSMAISILSALFFVIPIPLVQGKMSASFLVKLSRLLRLINPRARTWTPNLRAQPPIPKPQPLIPQEPIFLERLHQSNFSSSSTPPSSKHSSKSRPTVAEIFSPLNSDNSGGTTDNLDVSLSLLNAVPGPDPSNLFDVSQQLDVLSFD
jgi:hypothetical protein